MAILCIRVGANPGNTALRTQPGDVVCVMPDSHVFSVGERTSGQYRFITVTGAAPVTFSNLTVPVFAANGTTLVRIRNQRLDPVALAAGAWRTRTVATQAQIASITIARP